MLRSADFPCCNGRIHLCSWRLAPILHGEGSITRIFGFAVAIELKARDGSSSRARRINLRSLGGHLRVVSRRLNPCPCLRDVRSQRILAHFSSHWLIQKVPRRPATHESASGPNLDPELSGRKKSAARASASWSSLTSDQANSRVPVVSINGKNAIARHWLPTSG